MLEKVSLVRISDTLIRERRLPLCHAGWHLCFQSVIISLSTPVVFNFEIILVLSLNISAVQKVLSALPNVLGTLLCSILCLM